MGSQLYIRSWYCQLLRVIKKLVISFISLVFCYCAISIPFTGFQHFVRRGGGKAPYLNVNQLVNFLNQEQRDPRLNEILYPYYNKEKALSLIWKYEKSLDNLQRGIRTAVDLDFESIGVSGKLVAN